MLKMQVEIDAYKAQQKEASKKRVDAFRKKIKAHMK